MYNEDDNLVLLLDNSVVKFLVLHSFSHVGFA